jgi:hypothetical protein
MRDPSRSYRLTGIRDVDHGRVDEWRALFEFARFADFYSTRLA